VGCPWAGKEIENPTQTRVWRGLLLVGRGRFSLEVTKGNELLPVDGGKREKQRETLLKCKTSCLADIINSCVTTCEV
jgi:hypothetical protein